MPNPWPLAHRETDLAAIADAVADPGQHAVVLYGAAGVGKSRLADTCLARAEADGQATARVQASEAAALLPLGALAPVLPHDLGTSLGPRDLFERTRAELGSIGDGRVPILMVDDAHLLDTSSAVLLTQLVEAGAVFLVATIRDGEALPDAVSSWWRSERTLRIDVRDLDRSGVAEVLEQVLGGVVGADTVARLHTASGGNPLLLRELVLQATEAGLLRDDSGTWRLAGAIPPSRRLGDLLPRARLDALGAPARAILDQLAVCANLGPEELSGDPDPAELEALERNGLVRVIVDGQRHQLVLTHPLYGEAIRADLPALRRRAILLAAADRCESLGARRREDVRRIATWRLDAGGNPDPDLLLHAAQVARFANDFAQVERLARAVRSVAPWAATAPATTAEADALARSSVLLGEALYELGNFDEADAVLGAALSPFTSPDLLVQVSAIRTKNLQWGLCDWEQALQVVRDAQLLVGPDHAADLRAEESEVLVFSGLPQTALEVAATVAPRTPRTEVLLGLATSPAMALVGRTTEAMATAERTFAVHLGIVDPVGLAHPGTHILNQVYAMAEAGRLAEAEELSAAGYDVAVGDNVPIAQIWFALMIGRSQALAGRLAESARWYQEGASTGRLHGFHGPLRLALAGQAWASASIGDVASATACIAEASGLPPFPFFGYDQVIGTAWTTWAEGQPEQARRTLVQGAEAASATGNLGSAGWLWHNAARLGATGLADAIEPAVADVSDSPMLQLRAAHVRALDAADAEALLAVADGMEGLGLLLVAAEAAAAASDLFRRQGDQRRAASVTKRSASLAQRCPGVRTPGLVTADVAVPLSNREREIATLAAGGLTSQQIADRLYLSIRTVDNHLQKAYAKLGIHGRDELATALGTP